MIDYKAEALKKFNDEIELHEWMDGKKFIKVSGEHFQGYDYERACEYLYDSD